MSKYYYFLVPDLRHRSEDVGDSGAVLLDAVAAAAAGEAQAAGRHAFSRISGAVPDEGVDQQLDAFRRALFRFAHDGGVIDYLFVNGEGDRVGSRLLDWLGADG